MKRYKLDENTIWEDTGFVKVCNYPPSPMTESYVLKIYRQFKKGELGGKMVEGEPFYLHNMPFELVTLARIVGEAQKTLFYALKQE